MAAPPELWGGAKAVDLPAIEPLKWTSLDALIDARNEKVIPTRVRQNLEGDLREAWLADLGYSPDPEQRIAQLTVTPRGGGDAATRFAVLGDPGEGDPSQYAVVRPFLATHAANHYDFALVLSDVIYPAGDSADYPQRFYGPYFRFTRPIYALPGNHDWDDGSLTGFMTHFTRTASGDKVDGAGPAVRQVLRTIGRPWRLLWRGKEPPNSEDERIAHSLEARDAQIGRSDGRYRPGQPGPYFRIDAGNVWLICIDTGMTGTIDDKQARWLLAASAVPGPKILLTGKPLFVDGEPKECRIVWTQPGPPDRPKSVLGIVEDDSFGYVASLGGDIHNYQRYSVGGRPHLVAGGSGAFLGSTELIAHDGATHEPCALYPTRAASQVHFEQSVGTRLLGSRLLPGVACALGFVSALLFSLLRGLDTGDARRVGLGAGYGLIAAGLLWIVFRAVARRPLFVRIVAPLATAVAVLLVLPGLTGAAVGVDEMWRPWIATVLAVGAIAAFARVAALTHDVKVLAALLGLFALPLALGVLIPFPDRNADYFGEYFGGYFAALALFALAAVSLTRKLTAPSGSQIRARRPYATLGLAAAGWLTLMIVLSAYGTLTTFEAMRGKQVAFIAATALGVLLGGVLAHLQRGMHLIRLILFWLGLIGASAALLFWVEWNEVPREREAFRYGVFEGVAALGAGAALFVGVLTAYAWFKLRPGRSADQLAGRAAAIASDPEHKRHELIATILRAAGGKDFVGPIFETTRPPFLKSFVDVEVGEGEVRITTYRASGFEAEADNPVVVDSEVIPLVEASMPPT